MERFLKLLDGSLKTHGQAGRNAQLSNGLIHALGCFSQRRALLKVERYCGCGNLSEMVDTERAHRPRDRCHFIQRDESSFRRSKINFLKRVGRSLILRLYFQNHRILVRRRINVRYLTVSVRTVQRILNLLGRYAERKRAVPINIDGDLRAGDQQIAVDIDKAGQRAELVRQLWSPFINVIQIHALEGHLVNTGCELPIDGDGGRILKKRHHAGHPGHLRPQRLDGFVHRQLALIAWFHRRENVSHVALQRKRRCTGDVGIRLDHFRDSFLPLRHGFI